VLVVYQSGPTRVNAIRLTRPRRHYWLARPRRTDVRHASMTVTQRRRVRTISRCRSYARRPHSTCRATLEGISSSTSSSTSPSLRWLDTRASGVVAATSVATEPLDNDVTLRRRRQERGPSDPRDPAHRECVSLMVGSGRTTPIRWSWARRSIRCPSWSNRGLQDRCRRNDSTAFRGLEHLRFNTRRSIHSVAFGS